MPPKLRIEPEAGMGGGCPEQYDVYCGDRLVGYLRLRHGIFTAQIYHCDPVVVEKRVVYFVHTDGDGRFTDDERKTHLSEACAMIASELGRIDATVQYVQ